MIYPFLALLPQIRSQIYQDVLTPDLFNLMDTCPKIREEGLVELKGRIQRLGIRCEEGWGVFECKQAYLWCFGEPKLIFKREIPESLVANLTSRGVVLVGTDKEFSGAVEHTFKDWHSDSDHKRLIPIEGLAEKVETSDVILFVHRDRDYLLVRGKVWRLIDLTSMNEINIGQAECCTVDSVNNASYIITFQYKSYGVGSVRWCEISQMIQGKAQWRECMIDVTPYSPHYFQLDVIQNQIFFLEKSPGRQRGTINIESGQWVRLTHRPEHEPSSDSPMYLLRKQSHATNWDPITMKKVAIRGVPCYQWDLRAQGEFSPLEMRCAVKEGLMPQTIRALYKSILLTSEVVTVQSLYNGCFPILNIVYRIDQFLKCKTWRLMPPSQPFAELECSPISKAYEASDLHKDQWGENSIIRALRVNAHWAWEPLMYLFRNRLIEQIKNKDEDLPEVELPCYDILNTAALWNRPKFVEFFFCQWLPPLEKELKKEAFIDDIVSESINSIDLLRLHLLKACELGHVDVAVSLIKFSALNISLSDWQYDLVEWPPLKGAMHATYRFQWSAVIPILAAQDCIDQIRIKIYRYILRTHVKVSRYRERDPEGFAKMVVDLCNSKPALLDTAEAIAAAAIIDNRDLIGRVSKQATIDLPPYNGHFFEWEDIADHESLIFHALLSLEDHPEALSWFIKWLLKRKLPDRVEEALELMGSEWRKKKRTQSPPL